MNLNVVIRKLEEGSIRLILSGSLVIGPGAEVLMDTFDVLLGKYEHIIVDMTRVSRLDAGGIGCLVRAYAEGCSKGTRVSLRNLPPVIRDMLVIVKLITVFGLSTNDLLRAA